jgi:hypothetical protein
MELGWEFFYDYYSTTAKKFHNGKRIFKSQYRKLLADYYSAASKIIIYDSFSLYLSHKMGSILIYKYKSDLTYNNKDGSIKKYRLPIDWVKTKEIWKEDYGDIPMSEMKLIKDKPLVYLFNDHSDGYQYKWHWDKRSCVARNQSMYYFKPVRSNKRKLAKAIKTLSYIDYPLLET